MTVLVTDAGVSPADPSQRFTRPDELSEAVGRINVELPPDARPEDFEQYFGRIETFRIAFPSFSDGRGFTLARELRRSGFAGRLRAAGHVISDQYALARRCGFDEIEIPSELAERQPADHWQPVARRGYLDLLR